MFGFSRGAFTVRTLVGFIQTCGLVDPDRLQPQTFGTLQKVVNKGYKAYRKCYRPALWRMFATATSDANETFRKEHSLPATIPIRFLGVWDTVDAVGSAVSTQRRDQRDGVSVQVLRSQAQSSGAARLPGARDRRPARIVRAVAVEGAAAGQVAHRAGLVRGRALERRRRLPEAGHVAGRARLAAQRSGAAARAAAGQAGSIPRTLKGLRICAGRAAVVSRARERRRQALRSALRGRDVLPVEDPRHRVAVRAQRGARPRSTSASSSGSPTARTTTRPAICRRTPRSSSRRRPTGRASALAEGSGEGAAASAGHRPRSDAAQSCATGR